MSTSSKTRHNIVVLDGYTLNPGDLSWCKLQSLGQVKIYEHSREEEVVSRAKQATIILVNKVVISENILAQLPHLQCIIVTATGINNIDLMASKERNIPVLNASGYGTDSVAQHVFAMLLALTNQVYQHHQSVSDQRWAQNRDFSYWLLSVPELSGLTMGIYGLGKIGQRVADIALAFGMSVLATHKHPERDARAGVSFVDLETLFMQSDVVSLHAPLSKHNDQIVNQSLLARMKSSAILINTGRGGLINEKDLFQTLKEKKIMGAALDVLSVEPPPADHPLIGLENCLVTPHMAWASLAARQRLMDITIENIVSFIKNTK